MPAAPLSKVGEKDRKKAHVTRPDEDYLEIALGWSSHAQTLAKYNSGCIGKARRRRKFFGMHPVARINISDIFIPGFRYIKYIYSANRQAQ